MVRKKDGVILVLERVAEFKAVVLGRSLAGLALVLARTVLHAAAAALPAPAAALAPDHGPHALGEERARLGHVCDAESHAHAPEAAPDCEVEPLRVAGRVHIEVQKQRILGRRVAACNGQVAGLKARGELEPRAAVLGRDGRVEGEVPRGRALGAPRELPAAASRARGRRLREDALDALAPAGALGLVVPVVDHASLPLVEDAEVGVDPLGDLVDKVQRPPAAPEAQALAGAPPAGRPEVVAVLGVALRVLRRVAHAGGAAGPPAARASPGPSWEGGPAAEA
mmetsp:Transcript_99000/g.280394  ORF Transcript_99000/g.280394 Transcript_99000/m.280394 type:complete len:282 (+) Transcript_99000:2960-3805(+)